MSGETDDPRLLINIFSKLKGQGVASIDKKPVVELVAKTELTSEGIARYLNATGNEDFEKSIDQAFNAGLSGMEVLVSMMAKLCYKSLTLGHNANVTRVRDIRSNIESAISSGHGSVLEHASMSFIVRDCSRIFTHELVRHRAGTAYSQNSGRYIRLDSIDVVVDPILADVEPEILEIAQYIEDRYAVIAGKLGLNEPGINFDRKKKLTSALRRIAPNGQTNEIGFTVNLRALRFIIQKRTDRAAEWEIRHVFAQVYEIARGIVPTLFCDAKVESFSGLPQVTFDHHT
jgi:thymidylate synthase (FAD)